jgi:hypothetical protein
MTKIDDMRETEIRAHAGRSVNSGRGYWQRDYRRTMPGA